MAAYRLDDLAQYLDATLLGDGDYPIAGLATLQSAQSRQLSFLANPVYRKYLSQSRAGAVILRADVADEFPGNRLLLDNPYLGYARVSALFDCAPAVATGIHPSAQVAAGASVDASACIGAQAVVEDNVEIGANVQIGAGCYIGEDSVIGAGTRLYAGVSIYHGVSLGNGCIIHSGAVIGSDGFGIVPAGPEMPGWVKIHQLGGVEVGADVEIGANTTIDRGALDNTVISRGVKLDNQVHIAHNVRIGENTAVAGCVGIAGSTTIGANCTIAGAAGIIGHLYIADNVHITAMTLVTKSIREPGSYSSGTPLAATREWRRNAVRFGQLEKIATRLKRLEQQ
ncbi:UDP-3-O-(3-hydroxymyristoyl)glucosamine N-acyltransferase [Exilibacterium tricleocarpae]|uniref:UDP-3-O-acylglucosamine N-acyltransferase n=1 Tax=Exilibacterium tricleocarpae TaxID=2591008 RepID=A0A545U8G6_9GAMM|nr:UDP-3-O-(3-hydroxymyristoyl)glucosamine N-acyltransferase [Exilibacterium tricleocarpae]TQV85762.1 UDP-3-O-(3-hydroxymyristoyl)glucosamine N-acyltransferase [Exilibacterium tricleocarpae]